MIIQGGQLTSSQVMFASDHLRVTSDTTETTLPITLWKQGAGSQPYFLFISLFLNDANLA